VRRLAVLGVVVVLAACGGDDDGTPIDQVDGSVTGRTLTFTSSCHSEVEDLEVRESATEVHVRLDLAERGGDSNEDCGMEIRIPLDEPLGQRRVFDDTTGEEVLVAGVRRPVPITEAYVAGDDRRILIKVDECGRGLRARVVEHADSVELVATVLQPHDGSCTLRNVVQAPHPVDGRQVIDTLTGEPIPVVNTR
jgi:hypothetical protein